MFPCAAVAGPDAGNNPPAVSELWINPGMYTYHFQKDRGFNNENYGLGAEYRYSADNAITAGFFRNSDNQQSRYVGWYWEPLIVSRVRLGAVMGGIDGYPRMQNGGWFPAVIPTASIEFDRVGMNIMYIPSYKDRLYGGVSMQLKIKAF